MMIPYNWREMLKPSNIREKMNENTTAISIAALVVVIICVWFLVRSSSHPRNRAPTKYYFVDEATGQQTVQSSSLIPPLMGKGGKPTVVRAIYYTCTDCGHKKLAYYEKYTPDAKAALEKMAEEAKNPPKEGPGMPPPGDMMVIQNGELVRSPDPGSQWVNMDSEAGQEIVSKAMHCGKGNQHLRICNPDD